MLPVRARRKHAGLRVERRRGFVEDEQQRRLAHEARGRGRRQPGPGDIREIISYDQPGGVEA
ncbi:hypothetical protein AB0L65_58065 [Nonomuraea sp. NPDC052116]|uniref:hypothetical protein n=1 Tax=Nonomuraea sp. NPDC052116 TaxID=3155665 RepID=UPI0034363C40